jgi:hypothetical protein
VFGFDPQTRTSRLVRPASSAGPNTDFKARPFAGLGAKLYMTPRAFFRTDLRVLVDSGVDEVLFRFGFGVDF